MTVGPAWGLPLDDLDRAVMQSSSDLRAFGGARVLVTGGTGFLGSWIVATTLHAIERLDLKMRVDVVSRTSPKTLRNCPNVTVLNGDIREFTPPGSYDLVIHGAASSSAPANSGDSAPAAMASTIIDGTRRVLETASRSRARVLFLSSGAVYGPQTAPVAESATSGPDPLDPASAYGEAKRVAENFCATATSDSAADVVIGRLFAFVGAGIPLDAHYAVGNFLRDVAAGRPIRVRGDGRPLRSYLYCGDLPEWCWALIGRGTSGKAYNVGSPEAICIEELAHRVANLVQPRPAVEILGTADADPPPCYVPITDLSSTELQLSPRTLLDEALSRTFAWVLSSR